jgi:hypothetical protein
MTGRAEDRDLGAMRLKPFSYFTIMPRAKSIRVDGKSRRSLMFYLATVPF